MYNSNWIHTVQIPFLRENEDRTSEKELLKVAGFSYYNQSKSNVIFSWNQIIFIHNVEKYHKSLSRSRIFCEINSVVISLAQCEKVLQISDNAQWFSVKSTILK